MDAVNLSHPVLRVLVYPSALSVRFPFEDPLSLLSARLGAVITLTVPILRVDDRSKRLVLLKSRISCTVNRALKLTCLTVPSVMYLLKV